MRIRFTPLDMGVAKNKNMKVEIEEEELDTLKQKAQAFDRLSKIVEDAYTSDTGDLCTIGEDICRELGWL